MSWRDAAMQQWKLLQGMTLKNKIRHIYTYYKIPIITIALAIFLVVSGVYYFLSAKTTVLHITCLDTVVTTNREEDFLSALSQAAGIDPQTETIIISTDSPLQEDAYAGEVLAAQIMGGMIDVLAFKRETALQWLYQDVLADLSEQLSKEQLEKYKGHFLYVDAAVLEKMDFLNESSDSISFPDPTLPEAMEKPIPVALLIPKSSEFANIYFSNQETVVVAIVANAPHVDYAMFFIDHVMQ